MNYKFLIITIILAGFGIVGYSIIAGIEVRDAEVVDNAYETGLKFDETTKQAARLGWRVELPRTVKVSGGKAAGFVIMLRDREGGLSNASVDVTLNRMGSRAEQSYRCTDEQGGRYRAPAVPVDATGYWEAKVRVARGKDALSFDETIQFL